MLGTIGSLIAYPIVGNVLSSTIKNSANWALENSGKLLSNIRASGRASLSVIKSGARIKSYQDLRSTYLKHQKSNFRSIHKKVEESTNRFKKTIVKGYERRIDVLSRKFGGRTNFGRKIVKNALHGEVKFLPMTYVMYKAEQMQGNIPADQGFMGYYATTGLPLSLGFSAGFDIAKRSMKVAKLAAFSSKASMLGLESIAKVGAESLHNMNKMTKGMFAVYDNAVSKFVSANQTFKAFGSTTAALKAIGRSVHQVNANKAKRSDLSIMEAKIRDAELKDQSPLLDSYRELMGDVRGPVSRGRDRLLRGDIATGEGGELQRSGFNKKFTDVHRRLRKISGGKYYGDDVGYTGSKVVRPYPKTRLENSKSITEKVYTQVTQNASKIEFLGGKYDLGVFHIDSIMDSMDKIATQFLNIANRPWLNFLDAGNHWLQSNKTKLLTHGIQEGRGVVGLQGGEAIEIYTHARPDSKLLEEYEKGGSKVSAAIRAIQIMTKAEQSTAESYLKAKQDQAVEYARLSGRWNKFGAQKDDTDAVREFVAGKIAYGVATKGEWILGNGDILDIVGKHAKVHTKLADGSRATLTLHSGDVPIHATKLLRGDTRAGQIAGGLLGGKASIIGPGGVEIESGIETTTNMSMRKYYRDADNTIIGKFLTKLGDILEWNGGSEQSLFGRGRSIFTKYKDPAYVGKIAGDVKRGTLDRDSIEDILKKGDADALDMVKGMSGYSKKIMDGIYASMRATDMAEGSADPSKSMSLMYAKVIDAVRKSGKLNQQDAAIFDSFDVTKSVVNEADSAIDVLNKLRYTNNFLSQHESYLKDTHGFDESPLRQLQELLLSSKDKSRASALSGSLSGNGDRIDRYNKEIFDFIISVSSKDRYTRKSAARAISEISSYGAGRISSAKLRLGETNINGISAAMHMSTVGNSYSAGSSVDSMTQSELSQSIMSLSSTFLGSGRNNLRETISSFGGKKRVKEAPGAENKFVLLPDNVAKETGLTKGTITLNGTDIEVRYAPISRGQVEQLAAVGTMNSALSLLGLGFDLQSTFTVPDIITKTLIKRVLPIGMLFGAHDLATSIIQQTPILKDTSLAGGVTGMLWDGYAGARVLSQAVSDFTGITSFAQKMEELVPGSIDSPLSGLTRGLLPIAMGLKMGNMGRMGAMKGGMIGAGIGMILGGGPLGLFDDSWNLAKGREQVIAELSGEKEVAVSKGRFWELSGSTFWGDKISYFRPSLYALQKKQYQRADNYIGNDLTDMVQSYIDPGVYAQKHYLSRPYEMVGGKFSNIPLVGTGIDTLVGGTRYMHQDFLQEMSQSSLLAGGTVPGLQYSGSLPSTTPISSGRGAFYGGSIVGGSSISSLPVMSPTSVGAAADTTIDNMLDVAGLRGFMLGNVIDAASDQGSSGFSGGFRTESANDIASFSKSYWEKELGGIVGLCLHEDSEVLTNKGLVKIKNIEPDIEVLTPNGFKKVIGKTSRRLTSTESSFTIKTKLGEITATEDHKIFALESEFCKHDKYITCSPLVSCKKQRCKEYTNVKKVLWKPIKEITTDNWVGFPVIEGLEQKDFIIDFAEGTNYKAVGNRLFKKSSTDDLITCLEHLDKNGYVGKRTLAKKLGVAVSVATSACSAFKSEWSIRKRFYHLDEEMQKEFFWFLGLYCGDGSTYKWTTEITIGWKNRRVFRKRLIRLFNALGIKWSWKIGKFNSWGSFRINGPLSDWLNFHMGKGFASKRIPKMVWESYITNRLSFIGGLIDSDGCLTTRDQNIAIAVKNINLAKELNSLYLTCGIWSKFSSSFEIGKVDVPFSYSYLLTNYSEKCKVLNNKIVKNVTGVFIENNILFAKVISSTKNKVDVSYYDIEIDDPSHCFVANNIICHNSEGIRRIFPNPSPGDTERINRIANAMPLWLPGKDSFTDYLTGDPYSKVQMGEVRLPGKAFEATHNVYYTYPIDSMVMGKSYEEQVSFYAGDVTYLASLRRNWHVVERTRKELIGELKKTMPIVKEADVAYDVKNDVHSYIDAVMKDEKGIKTAIAVAPMVDNYADPGGAAQLNAYLVNNTKEIRQGLLIAMDKDGNISKQIIYADTKKYLNDLKMAQSAARQASKITQDLQEEGYSVNRWPAYSHLNRLQILCTPGDSLIKLENNSLVKIKDIEIGNSVLTAEGNYNKVTHLFKREAKEDICEIKTKFLSYLKLKLTKEHPVYCIEPIWRTVRTQPNKSWKESRNYNKELVSAEAKYIEAKDIKNTHYIGIPIPERKEGIETINVREFWNSSNITIRSEDNYFHPTKKGCNVFYPSTINVDEEIMWLFGLFVAEGNSNSSVVGITVGQHERGIIIKAADIFKRRFNVSPQIIHRWQSHCYHLVFRSVVFGKMFTEMFGKGAKNKRIPKWIFGLNKNLQLSFIESYLNGDGSLEKDGSLRASTSSIQLATDLWLLLAQNYIISTFGHKKVINPTFKNSSDSYVIAISKGYADLLFENEVSNKQLSKFIQGRKVIWKDKHVFLKVLSNINYQFEGSLYNLEVENDHSYVIHLHGVHNCNVSPFSKEAQLEMKIVKQQVNAGMFGNKEMETYKNIMDQFVQRLNSQKTQEYKFLPLLMGKTPMGTQAVKLREEAEQYSKPEQLIGAAGEYITHLRNPVLNKLMGKKSMYEQYREDVALGKGFTKWQNPVEDYIAANMSLIAAEEDPLQAAMSGATGGFIFGGPIGAGLGAGAAGVASLFGLTSNTRASRMQELDDVQVLADALKYKEATDLEEEYAAEDRRFTLRRKGSAYYNYTEGANLGEVSGFNDVAGSLSSAERSYVRRMMQNMHKEDIEKIAPLLPTHAQGMFISYATGQAPDTSGYQKYMTDSRRIVEGAPLQFRSDDMVYKTLQSRGLDAHGLGLGWAQQVNRVKYMENSRGMDVPTLNQDPGYPGFIPSFGAVARL